MNQAQNLSGAILFFFICLFAYTKLIGPIPFSVNSIQTTKSNFFTVTGTGEEKATPDTAMVSLGVTAHAPTSDEAKNQINTVTNKVVADLKAMGIEEKDIKTVNFSVYEDTSVQPQPVQGVAYKVAPPSPKSFMGSQTIEVTAKTIDIANKAIDIASADGANALGTPSFVVNEAKTKELTTASRKKAIADAKQKAQDLASEAGITLGKVVDVQENGGGGLRYAAMNKTMDAVAQSAPTELNPGENTISVSVTLSYETL